MTIILSIVLGLIVGVAISLWLSRAGWASASYERPLRHALAGAALAVAFGVLAARYGLGLELMELWGFAAVLLALSLTDIDAYRIPNACIACALAVRALYLGVACVRGTVGLGDLCLYALSGLGIAVVLAVIVVFCNRLLGAESMGGGDLKLFATAAAYVGWRQAVLLVLLACVFGIASSPLFIKRGEGAASAPGPFPFGPSIALACIITLLCGEPLVAWYVEML